MRLVVADSSPLNYLVWIEQVEILPACLKEYSFRKLCRTNCDTVRLQRAYAAGSQHRLLGLRSCRRSTRAVTRTCYAWTTANAQRSCSRYGLERNSWLSMTVTALPLPGVGGSRSPAHSVFSTLQQLAALSD